MWPYMITVVYLICLVFFIGYVYDDAFGDWVVCDGDVACRRLFLSIFLVLSNFWNVSFQQCTSVYIFGQVFYSKITSCLKILFYYLYRKIYIHLQILSFLLQILCNRLSSFVRKSSPKYQDTLSFGMDNRHTMCQSSGKIIDFLYERRTQHILFSLLLYVRNKTYLDQIKSENTKPSIILTFPFYKILR